MRRRWAKTPAWLVIVLVGSLAGVSSTAGWPLMVLSTQTHPAGPGPAPGAAAMAPSPLAAATASALGQAPDASSGLVSPSGSMVTLPTLPAPTSPDAPAVPSTEGMDPTSDPCAPMPKATGGTWECTLDEQFEGSELDRGLWLPQETTTSNFHSGAECLVDDPDNISVGGSVLTLTARREAQPFDCSSRKEQFTTQYTGAQVSTFGTWSQTYGRFEVRARFPGMGVAGTQAAIWMWPARPKDWPAKEEIDIAEIYSKYGDRATPFVHYTSRTNVTSHRCMLSDLGRFHTYAVEWTPEAVTFIYDGKVCLRHFLERQGDDEPFDVPFIIALSQFLGRKTNAFSAGRTPLPVQASFDYVRAWR